MEILVVRVLDARLGNLPTWQTHALFCWYALLDVTETTLSDFVHRWLTERPDLKSGQFEARGHGIVGIAVYYCLFMYRYFSIPQRFLPRDFAGAKKCIAELENNPIWVCARSPFHPASVCDLQVLAWLRRQLMISIKIAKDSFSYVSDSDLLPFCHQIPLMFTRITIVGYTK